MMIKQLFYFLFLIQPFLVGAANITVKIANAPSILYVASHYGKGIELVDTLTTNDGAFDWSTDQVLGEGIYFLYDRSSNARFEFLIGEDQDFEIELNGLVSHEAKIVGAEESQAFLAYQKFVSNIDVSNDEKIAYTKVHGDKAEDGTVLKLILRAMTPAPKRSVSENLLLVNQDNVTDYNALHFWDYYDLSDNRLLRTPFFAQRVEYFLRQELPPREDKIMAGVLPFLKKAERNNDVLRLVASAALSLAVEDRIMGIDALGYEVISRYYLSGYFGELPYRQEEMLKDYVTHTQYCRVGHKAKDITLDALEMEKGEVSLYAVDAPYVLLLFWEPDCDYCKIVAPALRDGVVARYYDKGLRVFAVNTQDDYDLWKNYVVKNELLDWYHGYQASGEVSYMADYGVQGTPFMYILDKNKNIVAKNVKLQHLEMMFERLFSSGTIY